MVPMKWSPGGAPAFLVPTKSWPLVMGIWPLAAVSPTNAPSTYSLMLEPSYVPVTLCQAPVDGSGALTVPTPAMFHLSTPSSSSRRYWLSASPLAFCRIRRLPPAHVSALIQAETVICDRGLRLGESLATT